VKELTRKNGFAVVVLFLIVLPVMLAAVVGITEMAHTVGAADIDAQEALTVAVKAAAGCVDELSQASGEPRIDAELAREAFRKALAENLGLDSELNPLENSSYKSPPPYKLLIYNGDSKYGVTRAVLYSFDGTSETYYYGVPGSGFPQEFSVSSGSITAGPGGDFTVKLKSPGVIAVIEIEAEQILGDVPVVIERWASARVVNVNQ